MDDPAAIVRKKLAELRSSIRWMFVAHGMARVVLAIGLLLIWHYLTDTFLHLPLAVRAGMLALMGAVTLFVLLRSVVYPLTRRIGEQELALLVEREYPLLNDRLITALQFVKERDRYRDIASAQMVDEVIREGFEVAGRLRFKEVVQSGRLLLAMGFGIAAMLALGVLAGVNQDVARRWAKRLVLMDVEYEREVKLDVQFPSDLERFPTNDVIDLNHTYDMSTRRVKIARNAGLRIIAVPKSGAPDEASVTFRHGNGESHDETMNAEWEDTPDGRRVSYFHYNVPAIYDDQEIFIEAGDAEEGPFIVDAVPAPALARETRVTYTYPAYMDRPELPQLGSRNLVAPEGTKVRIEFGTEYDQPLAPDGARVRFFVAGADPDERIAQALDGSRTSYAIEFTIDGAASEYEFLLAGEDGLRNTERYRYSIQTQEDRPPEVTFDFAGRGLEDESRVPVTLRGHLPLRYTIKDLYGVRRRDIKYRFPHATADWQSFAALGTAYEQRDISLRRMADGLNAIAARIAEVRAQAGRNEAIDRTSFVADIKAHGASIEGHADAFESSDSQLRPLDAELIRARDALLSAWRTLKGSLIDTVTVDALMVEGSELQGRLDLASDRIASTSLTVREYGVRARTQASEEFVLDIAALAAGTGFETEDKLVEKMKTDHHSRPIAIELRLDAEDSNYHEDAGSGGVGTSAVIYLELMPSLVLEGRISRYIRNVLKEELGHIYAAEDALLKEMDQFVKLQRGLAFTNDSEGDAAREIMSRSQTQQAMLPDQTLRLAGSFANVAQAYVFNDIEFNDPEKAQENRIQTVRALLLLLACDVTTGDVLANKMSMARTHPEEADRVDAVNAMLREAGLLSGMTGVRDSFDRMQFARLLERSEFKEPGSLQRLDQLYRGLLRQEATAEMRRKDLDAIRQSQRQALSGLEIVRKLVGRWENFDAIKEEFRNIYLEQAGLLPAIRELMKN